MKVLFAGGGAVCVAFAVWLCLGIGHGADSGPARPSTEGLTAAPGRLVVHEWGTFTSFSGSDGVPLGFRPNNTDLPDFVYYQGGAEGTKEARLSQDGTVSMETPVLYFYTDRARRASVRVDFPLGWITEWYPYAAGEPAHKGKEPRDRGQSMRWDVKLLPGEMVRFPREKNANHYYQARETDAVPVQAEVVVPEDSRDPRLRGGAVVQQEKFLFYRGVGTFPPPVTIRALGKGQVRVQNGSGRRLAALVLVTVRGGTLGFKVLGELAPGGEVAAKLPEPDAKRADLADVLVRTLTGAGLYEKEAQAMVKTWDSAWFGEDGSRLLYLVPRGRTDELLPLTVEPQPAAMVRVLVGRHDFLTPEQEAGAERQVQRTRAAQAELQSAEKALLQIGRFAEQARLMAEKRLDTRTARK